MMNPNLIPAGSRIVGEGLCIYVADKFYDVSACPSLRDGDRVTIPEQPVSDLITFVVCDIRTATSFQAPRLKGTNDTNAKSALTQSEAQAVARSLVEAARRSNLYLHLPSINSLTAEELGIAIKQVLGGQGNHQPGSPVETDRLPLHRNDAVLDPGHQPGPRVADLPVSSAQAAGQDTRCIGIKPPQGSNFFTLPPIGMSVHVVEVGPVRPLDVHDVSLFEVSVRLRVDTRILEADQHLHDDAPVG
ncbi:MAG: hypothetical protein JSR83_09115 [Proteobacteria bacterium]|nr:hypothetical protein [Pseudomonadota bacterium]